MKKLVHAAAWIVLAAVAAEGAILWTMTDVNWLGTVLAFGPRWISAIPVLILLPFAVTVARRGLCPLAIAGLIAVWPIGGLCLPLWADRFPTGDRPCIRVMTLNTDGRADLDRVQALITAMAPTLVALQESNAERWKNVFDSSWEVQSNGELIIASRFPVTEFDAVSSPLIPPWRSPAFRCRVAMPAGYLDFVNIHGRSPRDGLADFLRHSRQAFRELESNADKRQTESAGIADWAAQRRSCTVIAGDFNCTVESQIYKANWSRYRNAFSLGGLGWGATFFSRWHGVRIDHILTDDRWRCRRCWVGPDVGSAHRPLIADLTLHKASTRD